MRSLYEDLKQGLEEATEYTEGSNKNARITRVYQCKQLRTYKANEIREIRMRNHLSQRMFSEILGVSVKTVEAWEAGTDTPSGPARRLIDMIDIKGADYLYYIK